MDINSIMKTMLGSDAVKGISNAAGTTQKSVKSVLSSALPSLVDGAVKQAQDKATASSFVKAINDHAGDNTRDLGSFLSGVDLSDGSKIIGHLLGSKKDETVKKAAEEAGVTKAKANGILSAAAPLFMNLLGNQASSGSDAQSNNASGIGGLMSTLLSNVDVGSLLTGLISSVSTNTADEEETQTTTTGKKKTSKKKPATTTSSKKKTSGKKKTDKKDDKKDDDDSGNGGGILGSLLGLITGK
ncbi:MAG: DUF937 domain-containing protein [Clostridia bacterium]|nr:DUF937 domain-containing protein [Clostridia bacterium]MBO7659636.1 DUF937 domain-containing protein [Clostridia bacterium]MBP5766958.1 DUF937 domain-containing protein [Clostridia bacterium]